MPTPSSGPISFSNIVTEFGNLNGSPASLGEYLGRVGSDPSLTFGVEGVSNTGLVSMSQIRGKTAHASAKKIINSLKLSFPSAYFTRTISACDGTTEHRHPFMLSNPAVYNANCGGSNNGNLVSADVDLNLVNINQSSDNIDEDLKETYGATLIFLGYANARVTSSRRMTAFSATINGTTTSISDANLYALNDPGTDHGTGTAQGGGFHSGTLKTATAIYHTLSTVKFKNLTAAGWDKVFVWWNGNDGSAQSDTVNGGIILALPSKWIRTGYELYSANQGTMTLGPYEIGIVVNGGTTTTAPPRILTRTSGDAAATITPLYYEQLNYNGRYSFAIYANETDKTGTYSLAQAIYKPLVQTFKFISDGYASSVIADI